MRHRLSLLIVLFGIIIIVCMDAFPRYMNHFDACNLWFTSHKYYMMQCDYCRYLGEDMELFYEKNSYYPSSYGDIHGLIDRYYHGKHGVAVYVSNDGRQYLSFVIDEKYVWKTPIIGGLKKQVPDECTREELYWRNDEGKLALLEVFYYMIGSSNNKIMRDLNELRVKVDWCIREYHYISERNDNIAYVNLKEMLDNLLMITEDIERLVMQLGVDVPVSNILMEELKEVQEIADKINQLEMPARIDLSYFESIDSIVKELMALSPEIEFLLIPPDTVFRRL